jgi:hypothetical protein
MTVGGQACLLTTYWDDVSLVGGTALATEANARVRAMLNSLAATISITSTVAFDPTAVQLNQTTGSPIAAATGSTPAALSFTGGLNPLPLATQALFRYATGQFIRGRKLVGHTFLPGLTEGANDTGVGPNAAAITSLNTAVGLLGTTITSAINQVVWSRPNPAVPGSGEAWPVTARTTSTSWAQQRNRRS